MKSFFSKGFTKATYIILMSAILSSCSWVKPFCQEELWCTPDGVFDYIEDAVKVDLSQESIGYWEDYVDSLQPQFEMTAEKALTLAMPKTSYVQNILDKALSIGIQGGLPQTTTTNTSSSTENQSSKESTTSSIPTDTLPKSNLPNATLPNAEALPPSGDLMYDPIITYKTAAAIYEEVKLLNTYVKNAAMKQDTTAFVLRVQLTISPYARNEPYDVYIKLDSWAGCEKENETEQPENLPVTVLPLFVTDNLEISQTANAFNVAKQIAVSLGGVVGNMALQGQISDLISKNSAILGSDVNSLFTVGRIAENSLSIRIGASRIPNISDKAEYGMLTQNHSVTYVAFVPNEILENLEENKSCHITTLSATDLRHAITGAELKTGNIREALLDAMRNVLGNHITKYKCNSPENIVNLENNDYLYNIYDLVKSDDYTKFKECFKPNEFSEWDWGLLQKEIRKYTNQLSARFDIPKPLLSYSSLIPGIETQPLLLVEDEKTGISTTIRGLGEINKSQVTSYLLVNNNTTIPVATISQSESKDGSIKLTFPPDVTNIVVASKQNAGKSASPSTLINVELILQQIPKKWGSQNKQIRFSNLYYVGRLKPEKPKK